MPEPREVVALDSSVVVAALLAWHEHHEEARAAVDSALEGPVVLPSHVVLEAYSVMTRLPAPNRLAPADALALLEGTFASAATVAALSPPEVWVALRGMARDGIAGGATYDAEILTSAANAGATSLVTLNPAHFRRFAHRGITIVCPLSE